MSLLDFVIEFIPVANVPELIIRNLIGNDCLYDETISSVFKHPYKNERGYMYLDREMTVLHSFHDEPAVNDNLPKYKSSEYYRNGVRHRVNGPAIISTIYPYFTSYSEILWIFMQHGKVTEIQVDQVKRSFMCDKKTTTIFLSIWHKYSISLPQKV
jgi:hypothetical protein